MAFDQKEAARRFAEFWDGKGYEKGQCQPFWLSLLREVYGISEPEKFITFEDQVHLDNTSFIDGYIDSTHVMIEQKSLGKDLGKRIKQSDGTYLTPYEQAKRYSSDLPYSKRPRWIVTSNFSSFLVYDMEHPGVAPQEIKLTDLPEEYWRMEFLVDDEKRRIQKEQDVSIDAGKIIRRLYDALSVCYGDMTDTVNQRSLNKLIVRLVFCLYAEDSEMFSHGQFLEYVEHFDREDLSDALYRLFEVLDTKEEDRRRGLKPILAGFPYTNGGLFHDREDADDNVIPELSEEVRRLIIEEAAPFNWSAISPTIFGGIFESTLNPETRRSGGMHYTSIENIHKVIDPLFLDDLKEELNEALDIKVNVRRKEALLAYQEKIAGLKFLDPACGSGNFLTETYISLRRLENKVIKALFGEGMLGVRSDLIKVSIHQFYGIEINDFAVSVATTALWISEAQMLRETESIISHSLPALPLKNYSNIHEGNALRMDWNDVVSAGELNYIEGNAPFLGARVMSSEQKDDLISVFGTKWKNIGNMDYVTGWYKKSLEMMQSNPLIHAALVSTNSITQGEQVANLWGPLMSQGIVIDFAWRTFIWDSEASDKAHVHCVIIGFSTKGSKTKHIFEKDKIIVASNINAYLVDAPSVTIDNSSKPICQVAEMVFGSMPNDGGFLSDYSPEDKARIVKDYPQSEPLFHRFLGATEFINGGERWCLWLKDVSPVTYLHIPPIMDAISGAQKMRSESSRDSTRKLADVAMLFGEIRQPQGSYLLIPRHSSQSRNYIPIGFIPGNVICGDANLLVPDASVYQFGIMTSSVHMAWVKTVCGRIKSDYRYSIKTVYNNFPWPDVTEEQKAKIESTAQAILDAREKYPDASMADLYGELIVFPDLMKAHRANDAAVLEAYGFPKDATETEIVARLFKMYQYIVENKTK